MVNLVEILKDAPQGLKLYSLIYGDVTLESVDTAQEYYPIDIIANQSDCTDTLSKDGKIYYEYVDAECVLFPSKEHKTWDNWQEILFKPGDFIICGVVNISENQQNVCCIYNGFNEHYNDYAGHFLCHEGRTAENLNKQILLKNARYATSEEREQFMAELNANGYKWNADTKQIEKIEQQNTPKYDCSGYEGTITEEKPFFIDNLKPTQFVLVRDWNDEKWNLDIFSYVNESGGFVCVAEIYGMCIPYNDETKHLLGTTDDCPKKYKTW